VRPLEDRQSAAINGSPMAAINSVRMTPKDGAPSMPPAEAMGGSITAANRIDRVGAVFTITLPVPVTPRLSAEALS
jgi:hypothetical protein